MIGCLRETTTCVVAKPLVHNYSGISLLETVDVISAFDDPSFNLIFFLMMISFPIMSQRVFRKNNTKSIMQYVMLMITIYLSSKAIP